MIRLKCEESSADKIDTLYYQSKTMTPNMTIMVVLCAANP